jgi:molybdopterin-guanine dinucleotide biosynthesis protein A
MGISSIILAGGRATRMGGVDKGLVPLQNKPLVAHVIERLTTQVDEVLINANREIPQYQTFNLPVFPDESPDFIGPLAGFCVGLQQAKHEFLLTAPCDSPLLPSGLATRLMQALRSHDAQVAVATSDGDAHPVFCLCKKEVLPSLHTFITEGGRKASAWQKSLRYIEVDFTDCSEAFVNLNTFEDLTTLALKLQYA